MLRSRTVPATGERNPNVAASAALRITRCGGRHAERRQGGARGSDGGLRLRGIRLGFLDFALGDNLLSGQFALALQRAFSEREPSLRGDILGAELPKFRALKFDQHLTGANLIARTGH